MWALMHPNDPILFVEPFDRTPFTHGRMGTQQPQPGNHRGPEAVESTYHGN